MPSPIFPGPSAPPPAARAIQTDTPAKADKTSGTTTMTAWQGDKFSFGDLLDLINPLQHIPIVSTIYREITGDKIGQAAKLTGDTLFGGVIGLVASVVDTSLQAATGKDTGETVIAALRSGTMDDSGGNEGTDVAEILGTDGDGDTASVAATAAPTTAAAKPRQLAATEPADTTMADAPQIYERARARPLFTRATNPRVPVVPPTEIPAADPTLYQARFASTPRPLESSVPLHGVRGVAAPSLPAPRMLAANPRLVAAARTSGSAVPGMPSGAWVQLMQAAKGATPNGPSGLATATIARAMAGYGAGDIPLAALGAPNERR